MSGKKSSFDVDPDIDIADSKAKLTTKCFKTKQVLKHPALHWTLIFVLIGGVATLAVLNFTPKEKGEKKKPEILLRDEQNKDYKNEQASQNSR